jgi:hypothetical protein
MLSTHRWHVEQWWHLLLRVDVPLRFEAMTQ